LAAGYAHGLDAELVVVGLQDVASLSSTAPMSSIVIPARSSSLQLRLVGESASGQKANQEDVGVGEDGRADQA